MALGFRVLGKGDWAKGTTKHLGSPLFAYSDPYVYDSPGLLAGLVGSAGVRGWDLGFRLQFQGWGIGRRTRTVCC